MAFTAKEAYALSLVATAAKKKDAQRKAENLLLKIYEDIKGAADRGAVNWRIVTPMDRFVKAAVANELESHGYDVVLESDGSFLIGWQ
jgi:hypothetical protein